MPDWKATEAALLVKLAGTKAVKEAAATLTEGDYEVAILVSAEGELRKGADYEQSITGKVKPLDLWLATMDLLAGHISEAMIGRIVERAMSGEAGATLRRDENLKAATDAALKTVQSLTSRNCAGKLTASGVTGNVVRPKAQEARTGAEVVRQAG